MQRGREAEPTCCMKIVILVTDLPPGNKVGRNNFTPRIFAVSFFGHIEPTANLPRAETHWQDNVIYRSSQDKFSVGNYFGKQVNEAVLGIRDIL